VEIDRTRRPQLVASMRCLVVAAVASIVMSPAFGDEPPESSDVNWWKDFDLSLHGLRGDWHIYPKYGLRIDSPDGNVRLKLNGSLFAAGGYIETNDAIASAYPSSFGWNAALTRARLTLRGWVFNAGDFKVQMEFANKLQVKDAWFELPTQPYVGRIRIGNMKEPMSLDALTSAGNLTLMTEALPVLALSPGRNLGIMAQNAVLGARMTWSVGGFWNTGSFSRVVGAKDAFSQSVGFDYTGRITGLPVYADDGRRLVHLGLSVSRQTFTGDVAEAALPESLLTNRYLVDTGQYRPSSGTKVATEFAMVAGPTSIQAEYLFAKQKSADVGDPRTEGSYITASHFLTGDNRPYDQQEGVFTSVIPSHPFSFKGGGGGAVEAALRLSHVDLNSGGLNGGKETNLTAGLNWYLDATKRLTFNYVHAVANDRVNPPAIDGGRANIFQMRVQIDL
jgi:phosphate-selective porin OprO/OprP